MLIGAGKMSELAARHLMAQRRRQPHRHQPHLRARGRAGARVRRHAGAVRAVPEVPAAGRHRHRLDRRRRVRPRRGAWCRRSLRERKQRPIFFIDLSVPRNFDPRINDLDNVYLYDIDDLAKVAAEQSRRARARGGEGRGDRRRGGRVVLPLARPPRGRADHRRAARQDRGHPPRRAARRRCRRCRTSAPRERELLDAMTTRDRQQDPARADRPPEAAATAAPRRSTSTPRGACSTSRSPDESMSAVPAHRHPRQHAAPSPRRSGSARRIERRIPGLRAELVIITHLRRPHRRRAAASGRRQGPVRQGDRGGAARRQHRLRRAFAEGRARRAGARPADRRGAASARTRATC